MHFGRLLTGASSWAAALIRGKHLLEDAAYFYLIVGTCDTQLRSRAS